MSATAVTRIKQLCCLGLGEQVLVPALMRELHEIVPSYSNTFLWIRGRAGVENAYDESPDAHKLGPLYLREFFNRRDLETQPSLLSWTLSGSEATTTTHRFTYRNFYRSDLYNVILRELGYHHCAFVSVRDADRHYGLLVMHRSPGDPHFSASEERVLARLVPYMAHGFNGRENHSERVMEDADAGLLVLDLQGRLLHASSRGDRLLFLATHPTISAPHVRPGGDGVVPQPVADICRRLVQIHQGSTEKALPPVWRHRNPWGRFVFRAHWLDGSAHSAHPLIGVTINLEEPVSLKVLHQAMGLGLTPKQVQICQLLVAGQSNGEIAARLQLSPSTVVDHRRKIYRRLDVSQRSDLITKLLAASGNDRG